MDVTIERFYESADLYTLAYTYRRPSKLRSRFRTHQKHSHIRKQHKVRNFLCFVCSVFNTSPSRSLFAHSSIATPAWNDLIVPRATTARVPVDTESWTKATLTEAPLQGFMMIKPWHACNRPTATADRQRLLALEKARCALVDHACSLDWPGIDCIP
jgi:hypothetical protein